MLPEIEKYNNKQNEKYIEICDLLESIISRELGLEENKIWHSHPVWFINGNPIVGYSIEKKGVRLMFWSGADFDEEVLNVKGKKFKDASVFFNHVNEINENDIFRCLIKSKEIQWDYKNIVKRKGILEKL
jgi:hypothetical protein